MGSRRNLTQIPSDVEYYPMEHVLNLLRVVAAERDELFLALQNEQAKSAATAAAAAAASVYPQHHHHNHNPHHNHHPAEAFGFPFTDANDTTPHALTGTPPPQLPPVQAPPALDEVPSTFKVDAVKKRIAKKSYMLVKKTPHNKAKKPFTEINEAVPNEACALALFDGFEPKSDTNRLAKWELTGEQVIQWLHNNSPKHRFIHPVKFDGKVIAFGGAKPFVYAWAAYESLQAKFDKKGASLQLKFRTKMVGSGRPEDGKDGPPSLS